MHSSSRGSTLLSWLIGRSEQALTVGSELYERLGPLDETVKDIASGVVKSVTAPSSSKGAIMKEESEKMTTIEGLGISIYVMPASTPFYRENTRKACIYQVLNQFI